MTWEDVFVVVDDGRAPLADYDVLQELVAEQRAKYPSGLGCVAIVPPHAKPPSEEVRKALNATLESTPLKCICWCVEGSGFQAGMVRAVLTGLRFVTHRTYATHVASELETSMRWVFAELDRTSPRKRSLAHALATIREQRQEGLPGASVSG